MARTIKLIVILLLLFLGGCACHSRKLDKGQVYRDGAKVVVEGRKLDKGQVYQDGAKVVVK